MPSCLNSDDDVGNCLIVRAVFSAETGRIEAFMKS